MAKLVQVLDPSTSTALEVAAGGKLFQVRDSTLQNTAPPLAHVLCLPLQVVVEDEVTAKDILERGKLSKRVTIIPLNKVWRGR